MKSLHPVKTLGMLILLATVFLSIPSHAAKDQAPLSPVMRSLLTQSNEIIASRMGTNVDRLINDDPVTFASVLGATLYPQYRYAKYKNWDSDLERYAALKDECITLLKWTANHEDDVNPKTGKKGLWKSMEKSFLDTLRGKNNLFYENEVGVDLDNLNVAFLLDDVQLPKNPRLPVRQENPEMIELAGIEAGASETTSNYQPNTDDYPPVDVILGTWGRTARNDRITFRRQGNKIVASLVYQSRNHYQEPYTETVTYTIHSNRTVDGWGGQTKNRIYNYTEKHVCSPAQNTYSCRTKPIKEDSLTVSHDGKGGYYHSLHQGHWVKLN